MVPKWHRLGSISEVSLTSQSTEHGVVFWSRFREAFWSPRAPSEAEAIDFAWSVVQNRRWSFLVLGAAKVDFGVENRAQNWPHGDENEHPNSLRRSMRKWKPKHPKSEPKMDPKWDQKCTPGGPKASPKTHTEN